MSAEEWFWNDLLHVASANLPCPACQGSGIMAHLGVSGIPWSMSCPCCLGDGLVTIVPERKGTA